MNATAKQGVVFALLAYTMWGLAPLYFKQLLEVPSLEILVHRIVWSTLFLAVLVGIQHQWHKIRQVFRSRRQLAMLTLSSVLLGFNWWLFIWAINNDHMLDASLGYYINPLFNVALGLIFFSEKLNKLQFSAVALALTGVVIQLVTFGSFPLVAFGLAASFACYGLIRKTVHVDSIAGLLIESVILLTPAVVYWWAFADSNVTNMMNNDWQLNAWLMAAGFVTTLPLLCFVAAARRLAYSTLGFFQYIGPSIMFLFAVFVYQEQMTADRWVTFGFIWAALAVFTFASVKKLKKAS